MTFDYAKLCNNGLYDLYISDRNLNIHKFHNYFWIYERYFTKFVNKPIKMLEIGVKNGGSTRMFKKWLGDRAQIIGVDIDENCRNIDFPENVTVEIGDQSDPEFLKYLSNKYGQFNIVLDDGGHTYDQITTSFNLLFDSVALDGIYMIEDTCCQFWENSKFLGSSGTDSFKEFVWDLVQKVNADMGDHSLIDYWYLKPEERSELRHSTVGRFIGNVSVYESIVVVEKMERPIPYAELRSSGQ